MRFDDVSTQCKAQAGAAELPVARWLDAEETLAQMFAAIESATNGSPVTLSDDVLSMASRAKSV